MAVSRRTITLLLICGLLHSAAATVYNVGGDAGWTYQSQNSTVYNDEFSGVTLVPGDALNFTFTEGAHDVQRVSAEELASCQTGSVFTIFNNSTTITLDNDGTYNFICTFTDHCSKYGMHLTVTVGIAGAPNSPPSGSAAAEGPTSMATVVRSGLGMLVGAVVAGCSILLL